MYEALPLELSALSFNFNISYWKCGEKGQTAKESSFTVSNIGDEILRHVRTIKPVDYNIVKACTNYVYRVRCN